MSSPLHGLRPTDTENLVCMRRREVTQICVGLHDLQFNLLPEGNLTIWRRCELLGADGALLDVWDRETRVGLFRFPEVLMSPIPEVVIDGSDSFLMMFSNGLALRVVDNSDQCESFSIGEFYV